MASSQAGAVRDDPVTFEELAELEQQFADTELVLLHKQNELQAPLYEKRAAVIAHVSGFWAVVLEQAPPEVDQYISPSDFTALASLTSLDVSRFEITHGAPSNGDPRSVSFTFTFAENEFFTDKVLTKKFWYRRADDGWTGLVSEPVKIHWKPGKDLTGGMLDLAVSVFEGQGAQAQSSTAGAQLADGQGYDELVSKLEQTNDGSVSFFAWFGYRGRHVSSEESARATKKEEKRRERAKGKQIVVVGLEEENGSNGKEPAEAKDGEATGKGSMEEQSESDAGSKDEAIAERDEAIGERDEAIGERDEAIRERDEAIAERDEAIAERDEAIRERDKAIRERDEASNDEDMGQGVEVRNDEEHMGQGVEVSNAEEHMSEGVEVSNDEKHMGEGVQVSNDEEDMGEGIEVGMDEEGVGAGGIPSPPEMAREIFPSGEDLAVSLSEDLFPGAIKYFTEAHEQVDVAGSEPSEASELPEETDGSLMDPPDLEDSALISMVESDEERAKKRKRI